MRWRMFSEAVSVAIVGRRIKSPAVVPDRKAEFLRVRFADNPQADFLPWRNGGAILLSTLTRPGTRLCRTSGGYSVRTRGSGPVTHPVTHVRGVRNPAPQTG